MSIKTCTEMVPKRTAGGTRSKDVMNSCQGCHLSETHPEGQGGPLQVKAPPTLWCPPSPGLPRVLAAPVGTAGARGQGPGRGPAARVWSGSQVTRTPGRGSLAGLAQPGLVGGRQPVQGLVISRPRASERLCFPACPVGILPPRASPGLARAGRGTRYAERGKQV